LGKSSKTGSDLTLDQLRLMRPLQLDSVLGSLVEIDLYDARPFIGDKSWQDCNVICGEVVYSVRITLYNWDKEGTFTIRVSNDKLTSLKKQFINRMQRLATLFDCDAVSPNNVRRPINHVFMRSIPLDKFPIPLAYYLLVRTLQCRSYKDFNLLENLSPKRMTRHPNC